MLSWLSSKGILLFQKKFIAGKEFELTAGGNPAENKKTADK
jgi:hypothetical protein